MKTRQQPVRVVVVVAEAVAASVTTAKSAPAMTKVGARTTLTAERIAAASVNAKRNRARRAERRLRRSGVRVSRRRRGSATRRRA